MTTKTPLLLAQLVLVTTAVGCATESTHAPLTVSELGPAERESVRRASMLPNANAMILEPGENIRIRGTGKGRYVCSNGKALVCDRIGLTAYCFCPGIWQHR